MVVRALPVHRTGGLEYHTWDLATGLARRGHTVVLVTSTLPHFSGNIDVPQNVHIETIPGSRPGDYSISFFRNANRFLDELDRIYDFDILHTQEFAGLFLKRRQDVCFVVTVHGTMTTETPLWREYFSRLDIAAKLAAMWKFKPRILLQQPFTCMIQRSDRLIVDSDFTRRELMQIMPGIVSRIRLVPLGIDLARYPDAPRRQNDIPVIDILGRVQKMKGLEIAVLAADLLRKQGVRFQIHIAGNGDYGTKLQNLIAALDLHEHVKYMGKLVGTPSFTQFFARLDLLLFPDLTQPAFGLVAVEAMRYGVPIVGARSGAIPEVVTSEVGWLYDPWSAVELADTLKAALADNATLQTKSGAAFRHAQNFTSDRMAEQVEQVYRELIPS